MAYQRNHPGHISVANRMASGKKITRRRFVAQATLGLAAISVGDAHFVEPKHLSFERTEIPIRGLHPSFDGYRIALLSDFHLPAKASLDLVRSAFRIAADFKPDLIALPGDFVHKRVTGIPDFTPYFEGVSAPDGVVGTLGNHDHWVSAERVREALAHQTSIELIENTHKLLRRGDGQLAIGGVGDLWCGYVNPVKAFMGVPHDVPRVLLSHNPDFAEDMSAKVRVDLQLSGHTHGGEVRIPLGPAPVIPSKYGQKFREGLCQGKRHRVYVTRGICTVCRFRFCCPPEVTGIVLRSA